MEQTGRGQPARRGLDGGVLREASLTEAGLTDTKLVGASFESANLNNASLNGANCAATRFFRADLRGATLSVVSNLTQSQIEAASGDTSTSLAPGLVHPNHWLPFLEVVTLGPTEVMRWRDFNSLGLTGTSFRRANLAGIDLRRMVLGVISLSSAVLVRESEWTIRAQIASRITRGMGEVLDHLQRTLSSYEAPPGPPSEDAQIPVAGTLAQLIEDRTFFTVTGLEMRLVRRRRLHDRALPTGQPLPCPPFEPDLTQLMGEHSTQAAAASVLGELDESQTMQQQQQQSVSEVVCSVFAPPR